jgi:hypothetical protein
MAETPLATTLLGTTGLDITCVGFGAWAIGGGAREFGSDLLTGAMTRERIARLPDDDRHPTTPGAVAVARAVHNPAVDGANRRPDDADLSMIDGRTAR